MLPAHLHRWKRAAGVGGVDQDLALDAVAERGGDPLVAVIAVLSCAHALRDVCDTQVWWEVRAHTQDAM
jgi:hypothetical protein